MFQSSNTFLIRSGYVVVLIAAAFSVPWQLTIVGVLVGLLTFSWFFEGVLLSLLIDAAFAPGVIPWLALFILLSLLVIEGVTYYIFRS